MRKLLLLTLLAMIFSCSIGTAMIDDEMSQNGILSDKEMSVGITFVGTSSLTSDEVHKNELGTYDIISKDFMTLIVIKVNFSGYTEWRDIKQIYGSADTTRPTVGQLDLLVDGQVSTIGSGYTSWAGGFVVLIDEGDHQITAIYSNMGEDGTFMYAMDSITIRVRSSESAFDDFIYKLIDLDLSIADEAQDGLNISRLNTFYEFNWEMYIKNSSLGINKLNIDVDYDEIIIIDGLVDTTGSMGDATVEWQSSTIGHLFLVDAKGVHLIDPANPPQGIYLRTGSDNYVGILAFCDAGIGYDYEDFQGFYWSSDALVEFKFNFDFFNDVVCEHIYLEPETDMVLITTLSSWGNLGYSSSLCINMLVIVVLYKRNFRKTEI
ncbi:MAG: hypothetical protein INQ03_02940 [Candidatus Heimdallarchaeota archaeon]|nr:hypothetical protein [Candidatus Heimdallarchaeota archaeon]